MMGGTSPSITRTAAMIAAPVSSAATAAPFAAKKQFYDDPRRKAADAMRMQEDSINSLMNQSRERAANEEAQQEADRQRKQAKARQTQIAMGASGRASTIQTSPLGIVGPGMGLNKGLLGI